MKLYIALTNQRPMTQCSPQERPTCGTGQLYGVRCNKTTPEEMRGGAESSWPVQKNGAVENSSCTLPACWDGGKCHADNAVTNAVSIAFGNIRGHHSP